MNNEENIIRYNITSKDTMKNSNEKKGLEVRPALACSKSRKIIITSIVVSVMLIIALLIIILYVYPCIKCTSPEESFIEPEKTDKPTEGTSNTEDSVDLGPLEEEFTITTNENDLTRVYVNQKSYENITLNGQITQILVDRKTNYDIYIISSTESDEETKKYYNKTYLCAITISSECISTEDEYCIPEKLVDFADQDYSHVRNLDEVEDLENMPIPFCLFNLTNNNVITSMLCPKTLSPTKKYTMILDLYFFRPPSIKRPDKDKSNNKIDIENLPNNQKLIKEKNQGICDVENYMNSFCTTEMNTTVDSNNKLIKYDEIAFTRIETDQNNSYIKNKTTNLIDKSNINEPLNTEKYNETLWKLFSALEPYMQYDEHFSLEQFKELYSVSKNVTKPKEKRVLSNQNNNVVYSDNLFFFEHYGGVILNIDMKDNTGIGSENVEALVDLKIDNDNKNLIHLKNFTNIDKIISKLILLSKSGNNLATALYEKINENLNNLVDTISVNITYLNKYIFYKELTSVFDYTFSLDNIKNLDYKFVGYSDELINKLDTLYNEIDNGSIKKYTSILNKNIYDFIKDSHMIIDKIFTNLKALGNKLNSPKNRITEISTYYLNYTSTSYISTIKEAQNILMTYYQKENDLIIPQVNKMLEYFEEKVLTSLEKQRNLINNLYENLEKNNYNIENSNIEEYNKTIVNLCNSGKYINEIIELVKNKVNKELELKDGYFISTSDINSKNEAFSKFIEEALIIANKLDNDELIDKKFDEIMIRFRESFTEIIKYMNKIKEEEFPLNENILKDNFFTDSEKKKISSDLESSAVDVVNSIRNENNYYLNKIDEKVGNFLKNNKDYLIKLINELEVLLTKDYFKKIENYYDKSLESCFQTVNKIIRNNADLSNQYFQNLCGIAQDNNQIIKLLKNFHTDDKHLQKIIPIDTPNHYWNLTDYYDLISSKTKTTGYMKKYNVFKTNIDISNNYVSQIMPRELLNQYQNVISKIKELLNSVTSNKITDLYPDFSDLFFINDNYEKIKNVYPILNDVLSEKKFNSIFLTKINDYKNKQMRELNEINKYIEENHTIVNTQTTSNDNTNDFCIAFLRKKTYTCTNGAISHLENSDYYCLPLSDKSDNYIKLQNPEIDSDPELKEFIKEFDEYYSKLSININSYNEKINELNEIITSIEKETLEQKITLNYLSQINETLNSILSKKYGDELINASYSYYKKNMEERIENILNNISEKWNNSFNKLENDVNENLNEFRNTIIEFGIMALAYETVITNNITKKFFESIENHQKNELNYTISYYYNFLIKEINSIYQYLFNKIPTNSRGFNNIINKRKNEINELFNEFFDKINSSKKEALSIKRQNYVLGTSSVNFFGFQRFLSNNIDSTSQILQGTSYNILGITNGKENDENSFSAKFYLENSESGKQIEEFYEPIKEKIFVDLNLEAFKELLFENWIFDKNDFINKLNITLENYNLDIKNEYLVIQEQMKKDLEGEINNFFTKENIYDGINNYYSNQIKEFDETKITQIKNYIEDILKLIKLKLSSESQRIKATMIFYTSDFSKILNTLKNIKEEIYNKTKEILIDIISEFHDNLINVFYINYIKIGLDNYIEKAKNYKPDNQEEFKLLSSTYNITNIIVNLVTELVEDYKNKTKMKIDDQYEEFINKKSKEMKLEEIKKLINDEIDNEYNSNLLKSLEEYATFTPGESDYVPYDLNEQILKEINDSIISNIGSIKEVILKIKGDHFSVDLYDFEKFDNIDFSGANQKFREVYNKFSTFITPQISAESNNINEFLKKVTRDNFNTFLNITIPTFGNEFFERIIKYNENFKIITLYDNLKYSLVVSLQYYIFLYELRDIEELTKDLKLKLYNLNNLDLIADKKNKEVLQLLNEKVVDFIEQSQKDIIRKYFSFIQDDPFIESSFNPTIIKKINENFEAVRKDLEDDYTNSLNIYLKEKLISSYTKTMNDKTNEMIQTVENQKELIRSNIDGLFTLAPEKILDEINEKINNTLESINEYTDNLKKFKISDQLNEYLFEFGENLIKPIYEKIDTYMNGLTKTFILSNLEKNANDYEEDFQNDSLEVLENINSTINTFFIEMTNSINEYGQTEAQYENYLDTKIGYFDKRRRLNNEQTNEDNIEEFRPKIPDKSVDETFHKLLNNSKNTIRFINSFEEFKNIVDNISKNSIKLNTAYKNSEKLIKDNNYEENANIQLINKLEYLKNMTSNYYNDMNETFNSVSENIKQSINKIDKLLKKCANITYSVFIKKYEEISKESQFIDNEQFYEEEEVNKITSDSISQNTNFTTEVSITSLIHKAKFKFALEFEEDGEIKKPKVLASIINESKPKKITFLVYSGFGTCGKYVQRIIVEFNGVNYTTNIDFNTESTKINATVITKFDQYKYSKERYYIDDAKNSTCKTVMGVPMCVKPNTCDDKKENVIESLKYELIDKKDYSQHKIIDD